jgi:hypothetical protein
VAAAQAIKLDSVDVARSLTLKVTLPNPSGSRPDRQIVRWGYNAGGPGLVDTIEATRRDSVFLYASRTAAWIIWACRDATRAGVVQSTCTQYSHVAQKGGAPPAPRPVPTAAPDPEIVSAPTPRIGTRPAVGLYAHQPAGYQRIAEIAFDDSLPNNAYVSSGAGIRAGCWERYGWGGPAQLVATRDPSAPISAPGVNAYTWPAGLPVGNSAGMLAGWACPGNGSTDFRGVYESGWIKLAGSVFEAPEAGMKLLGFWGVGRSDKERVSNEIYTMTPGGIFSQFSLDWVQQGQVSRRLAPNRNGAPLLTVGQWGRYEVLMTLNTIGQSNGTLTVWLNGTLTHDYRDVVWRTAGAPAGFYGRSWNPIWGGMGNPPTKTKTDVMLVDHLYISGIPQRAGRPEDRVGD